MYRKATNFWRKLIINTNKLSNPDGDILGAAINLTTMAVELEGALPQAEKATSVPASQSSPRSETEIVEKDAPDLVLTNLAASGNISAFELLYERYHRRTYSLCLRMTCNQTEAEDLTQEVFIQLFRKIGSFRGDSAFSTWLHRLTVNQVLMHFRRRSVKNEKTSEDGEIPEQIVPGTENQLRMPVIDRIALTKAVSQLPPGYRSVFLLHDVEGYEHEEVAKLLKISVGTSKSQLHKARLKLRGLLIKQIES
ncbi:MAG: RNA polymerase sigma factor [Acidobacteria bacterium]|nr:RNA polymerase sigma factor [Acidobacteriota bacterium]MCA1637096.1 RNA polymerase sigma factor [Acidobacteriota bacterium]